jgi:hypothetical protein
MPARRARACRRPDGRACPLRRPARPLSAVRPPRRRAPPRRGRRAARSCGWRAAHAGPPSPHGPSSSTTPRIRSARTWAATARGTACPAPASSSAGASACGGRPRSSSNSASATATPDALSLGPGEKPDSAMSTAAANATSSTTVGTSWPAHEPGLLDAAEPSAGRPRHGDAAGRQAPMRTQPAPPAVVEDEPAPRRVVGRRDDQHGERIRRVGQHVLRCAAREQWQRPAGRVQREHRGARNGHGQPGCRGHRRQQAARNRRQAADRERRNGAAGAPSASRPTPRARASAAHRAARGRHAARRRCRRRGPRPRTGPRPATAWRGTV